MTSKKVIEHDDKKIIVYENVFNRRECLDIYNQIVNANFVRTNIDCFLLNNVDRDVKWMSPVEPNTYIHRTINEKYFNTIKEIDWNKVKYDGQYINYNTYNSVDMLHTDRSSNDEGYFTILHYANHTWDVNWHGLTTWYTDDCSEIIYAAVPKPGNIIVFDSRIQHSSTAPSPLAEHPRYTIATKLHHQD